VLLFLPEGRARSALAPKWQEFWKTNHGCGSPGHGSSHGAGGGWTWQCHQRLLRVPPGPSAITAANRSSLSLRGVCGGDGDEGGVGRARAGWRERAQGPERCRGTGTSLSPPARDRSGRLAPGLPALLLSLIHTRPGVKPRPGR